jgi:predicted  nucleic acid-binding Zn-ribbon protein
MAISKTKGTSEKIKELTGIKPETVEQDELAKLQSSVKTIDQLTHEVGTIEVRKHALMKAMESVQTRIEGFRQELLEKYGTDNINIQDGKINYPEENTTPNSQENGEADKKD